MEGQLMLRVLVNLMVIQVQLGNNGVEGGELARLVQGNGDCLG